MYLQDTFPSLSVYKWVRGDNKQNWLKCKIYISSSSLAGFFLLFVVESSIFFLCFRFLPTREHKILIKRRLKTVQMRTYVYSFVYGFVCQFYSSVLLHSSFPILVPHCSVCVFAPYPNIIALCILVFPRFLYGLLIITSNT